MPQKHVRKLRNLNMKKFWLVFLSAVTVICVFTQSSFISADASAAFTRQIQPIKASSAGKSAGKMPKAWNDNGIFSKFYAQAYKKLSTMTLNEKIGQMILARCSNSNAKTYIKKYHFGGFVLFKQDFTGKTTKQVQSTIKSYQDASSIPMLMAVDEEGGTVVRISSNPLLSNSKFQSPQDVYAKGGFTGIRDDTVKKAALLKKLGLNVNLAPVSDVSTNPNDYIYQRSFGKPAALTGKFVSTVVTAMNKSGLSSTLKHFPGYGNNVNTHTGIAIDKRTYSNFVKSDFIPFRNGISAGAESIMVAHTVVKCMDKNTPASLSPAVHRILRNNLHFTGVIMTDDLSMGAISDYTHHVDPSVKAVLAGNDMLILSFFTQGYNAILKAVKSGTISNDTIDKAVFRVLAWKYAKGILR